MNVYFINLEEYSNSSVKFSDKKSISTILIKKILAKELCLPINQINLSRTPYGKPYMLDKIRHFNMASSCEAIMIVTDDASIGADIEYIKEIDNLESIAKYFAPEECENLLNLQGSKRVDYFYRLWVLKESYVKAIGKGLNCPLDSFCIDNTAVDWSLVYTNEKDVNWNLKCYSFPKGYRSAICAKRPITLQKPVISHLSQFLCSQLD